MPDVLFTEGDYTLRKLDDVQSDGYAYSLRTGPMYVEFTTVQPLDETILLGPNASVRRDEIPDNLERLIESLY